MGTKTALITGITGQDGSFLAELLLDKGYQIYGLVRRLSKPNLDNIEYIADSINLIDGDLADQASIMNAIIKSYPDEIYNLAAQSFVATSWQQAEYTCNVTGLGAFRVFEAARMVGNYTRGEDPKHNIKIYQASSIAFDTPVFIRKDGEIKRTTFGDTLILENFEVLSVDRITKEVKFLPVKNVLNHGEKDVFEIIGQTGLKIKLTSDHSVMVFDDNGYIVEKKTSDLEEGDCLITFVGNILKNKDNDTKIKIEYEMGRGNNTPILIKKYIELTEKLMKVVGIYLANGHSGIQQGNSGGPSYRVSFTFGNTDRQLNSIDNVIKTIKEIFETEPYEQLRDTSIQINYSSKVLYTFISLFGHDARSKRIPSFIWSIPKKLIVSLLDGYSFDAYLKPEGQIRYGTVNKELAIDINYLLRLNNISTYWIERYCEEHISPQGNIIKGTDMYDIEIPIEDNIIDKDCKNRVSKTPSSRCLPPYIFKQEKYYHLIQNSSLVGKNRIKKFIQRPNIGGVVNSNILNIINSNLGIIRIKYIINIGKEMVGDYEVPGSECFFCGNQPILAHNSSEMFGDSPPPQNELTQLNPRSPYGAAKAFAHNMAKVYRDSYDMYITCGILFNHESERRGIEFVSMKIANAVARIDAGLQDKLKLGNLDAKRDWGYTKDYVDAMWMMMQQDKPDNFVVASGENHTIREFVEIAFNSVSLDWQDYVIIDPSFFRPAEIYDLRGDYSKAKKVLGWEPKTSFKDLVKIMVDSEIEKLQK